MIKWLEDGVFYEVYPQSFPKPWNGIRDIGNYRKIRSIFRNWAGNALWSILFYLTRFTMRDMM